MPSELEAPAAHREVTIHEVTYEVSFGSDVSGRDGVYLEAAIKGTNPLVQVAEVFYSDASKRFFVSCFEEQLPLELVEFLVAEAKKRLPEAGS